MMPISTTLPITASTMVTALGAELHAGNKEEKVISSGASVSRIKILGCNDLDHSHRAGDLRAVLAAVTKLKKKKEKQQSSLKPKGFLKVK